MLDRMYGVHHTFMYMYMYMCLSCQSRVTQCACTTNVHVHFTYMYVHVHTCMYIHKVNCAPPSYRVHGILWLAWKDCVIALVARFQTP